MKTSFFKKGRGKVVLYTLEYPYKFVCSMGANSDDSFSECLFGNEDKGLENAKMEIIEEINRINGWKLKNVVWQDSEKELSEIL